MPRIAQRHSKRLWIQKNERGLGMKKFGATFKRFLVRTDGFEMVEYGVMTAMIVGAVIIALVLMMVVVSNSFAQVAALL